jgi:hypothetical protein
LDFFETTARETKVLTVILRTGNDPRFVVGRQTHRLGAIEFRILKCGEPDQAIPQCRWQVLFGDVHLIGQHQFKLGWQWIGDRRFLATTRRWCGPGEVIVAF